MSRHSLPIARHAANECGGWAKIMTWLILFHKPRERDLGERVYSITNNLLCLVYNKNMIMFIHFSNAVNR